MTKYVQSRLLQNCLIREMVKHVLTRPYSTITTLRSSSSRVDNDRIVHHYDVILLLTLRLSLLRCFAGLQVNSVEPDQSARMIHTDKDMCLHIHATWLQYVLFVNRSIASFFDLLAKLCTVASHLYFELCLSHRRRNVL